MPKIAGRRTYKQERPYQDLYEAPKGDGLDPQIDYDHAVYFDPGNRYTGVAIFQRDPLDDTWDCVDAFTWDIEAEGANIEKLWNWLSACLGRGEYDIVGYEKFRLFEDKAKEQTGSEFGASQLIGVIKYLHHRNITMNRWPRQPVELVQFLPENKKAVAGIMKKRGISSEARRRGTFGDHAWDAELQGYYDIIKNRGWNTARKAPTEKE